MSINYTKDDMEASLTEAEGEQFDFLQASGWVDRLMVETGAWHADEFAENLRHVRAESEPSHPPIDGAAGDDELECAPDAPTGYHHIDGSEALPWSGPGIALLIVFCGTVWLVLREVVQ